MKVLRQLTERRVPHLLAIYMGACWGVIQFINFWEERYDLSPYLTDIALLGSLLLVPGVLTFAYNHGRPGRDAWTRADKIGLPLNVVLAVLVLVLVYRDKELGSVVRLVTTQDEQGKTVEHAVANTSYQKRIALYNFDAPAEDTTLSWLRYGLPIGMAADLSQDMFVDLRISSTFRDKLRQLGHSEEVNVPFALKRDIAEEYHIPYFSEGRIRRTGEQIEVELALYETSRGELVQRRNYKGTDVFVLIDEISAGLKRDLEIPQTSKVRDLPVSEVLTTSLPAFREFSDGATAVSVKDQWPAGLERMEKAVRLDTTFAHGWLALHNIYLLNNQGQKSLLPLQKAMDYNYRLPERHRYVVKAEYYMMKEQDPQRAYAVAEMMTKVYPEDIAGYELLSQFQLLRNDRDGMIKSAEKILELDPLRQEKLRQLGGLYLAKGEYDNALRYYSQYAERFPQNMDSFVPIAELQQLQGKHQDARANFERAEMLSPGNLTPRLNLADLDRDLGNFDAAQRQYEEALAGARSDEDRVRALDALARYHEFRGELRKALQYIAQSNALSAKVGNPMATAFKQLGELDTYVRAGQVDAARQTLKRVSALMQPPFDAFAALGEMSMELELGRASEADSAITRLERAINSLGMKALEPVTVVGRGRLAELRDQCDQAIAQYEAKLKMDPADVTVHSAIGRCHRKMSRIPQSIEHLQATLKVIPAHPRANYEMGLARLAAGDREQALNYLRKAVQAWANADATNRLAAEARAKLREVESGS